MGSIAFHISFQSSSQVLTWWLDIMTMAYPTCSLARLGRDVSFATKKQKITKKIQISFYLKTCFCISVPAYVHIYAWKEYTFIWPICLFTELVKVSFKIFFQDPFTSLTRLAFVVMMDTLVRAWLESCHWHFKIFHPYLAYYCDFVEVSTVTSLHFRSCYHTKPLLIYVLHKDY